MNTNSTLLIRKSTKQAWSQAAKQPMLDSVDKLDAWAQGMNTDLGWDKYAVLEKRSAQPVVVKPLVVHEPEGRDDLEELRED